MNKRNVLFTALLSVFILAVFSGLSGCASSKGKAAPKTQEKIVYQQNFESGTGGWVGRGGNEKIVTAEGKGRDGSTALSISNRKKTWNGPIREMSTVMTAGKNYKIAFWAKYEEGPDSQALVLSVQQAVAGENDRYQNLGADRLAKGEWSRFEIEYEVPRSKYEMNVSLYLETPWKKDEAVSADDVISFYIDDIVITQLPPTPPPAAEKDIPALHTYFDFPIGAAIHPKYLRPEDIHNPLMKHFNAFVYGNEMKQDAMQRSEGNFEFANADALVEYAAKNNVKVRGHVLVWHSQVPDWLFQGSGDNGLASKEVLYARMEKHIKTIAGRYKGKIDSWDVVNECIAEDGTLRNSKYLQIAKSDEYIANAFRWAREADPNAKLFINDYNTEYGGAKQEGFYKLVVKLLEEGVPIDGVGFQTHISIARPSVNEIRNTIRRFSQLKTKDGKQLLVQITELDVSIYADGSEAKKKATSEILLEQARKYKNLFTMFSEEHKAGNLDMVVVWGIADDGTWLDDHPTVGRIDHPLFFAKDLRAKPAYWAIVNPEKLPVYINRFDSIAAKETVTGPEDKMWGFVTPKNIADVKGTVFGSFKTLWTKDNLYILADIADTQKDGADSVTFYLEPKNLKGETRSPDASTLVIPRSKAYEDTADGYKLFVTLPFGGTGTKLAMRAGFDLRIQDGDKKHSFNDFENTQENRSINYSTITMKELPPVTYAKRGTPRIDGRADPVWNTVEAVPLEIKSSGYTLDGSTFKTLWDDENLYVLFEVKDSALNDVNLNAYEQDSVEIFVDQNNAKASVYEADDAQYRVSFRNKVTFNGGNEELFTSKTRMNTDGYVVEASCPLDKITPAVGSLIGFDVQVNEADSSGARTGIRNWSNSTNMGYQDMSGCGVLMLIE